MTAGLIYFSGVTLSLYSNAGLGRFLAVLEMARQKGTKVAFDTNYRPRDWKGDLARARTVYGEALKRVDIALPSFDDEATLWGDASPDATVERLAGVRHRRDRGQERRQSGAGRRRGRPRIRTGAGRGRRRSTRPRPATASARAIWRRGLPARRRSTPRLPRIVLAAEVVRHRGAIIPRAQKAMH